MKNIIAAVLLVFTSIAAHAVDTSGCSQTVDAEQGTLTVQGKDLSVSVHQAPFAGCWNQDYGRISIELSWQPKQVENDDVSFWVSVNGQASTVKADSSGCETRNYRRSMTDQSGANYVVCSARVRIPTKDVGAKTIEIAPSVNGNFDVAGYGKNYVFKF